MGKIQSSKGFTLAELLIVVAIIAVLVAVSIPIFSSQLEKARESADLANWRAAKAGIIAQYLMGELPEGDSWYDAAAGVFRDSTTFVGSDGTQQEIVAYGKGTRSSGFNETSVAEVADGYYVVDADYSEAYIVATNAGEINIKWVDAADAQRVIGNPLTIEPDESNP